MRKILHIDMDAFYASVEQRDNPTLRGKPVAVGGDPSTRGVVAAASYEARTFGVRSAIPMSRAVRLCPSLVIVRPDFQKYRGISQQIFALYREVTPLVEPLSLDEAYLDVTANSWNEPLGVNVARRLKAAIKEATNLTASAGVAPNKFLAKIASGWKKPDGLTVVAPERMEGFLQGLPVDALWGVGPVTAAKLREHGIEKLTDIRTRSLADLEAVVGSLAPWLIDLAQGKDDRRVEPNRPSKSASAERTYARDLSGLTEIRQEIDRMAREVAGWLQNKGITARTITIKVRYDDFTTVTRSHSTPQHTDDVASIVSRALALLSKTEAGARPVRLLGVGVHKLSTDDDSDNEATPDLRLPFS
ncbi:MAG: DNA polymerase IV [Vicinamibacterales bacterium]|jgi:DNA polymerase-4